MVADRTTGSKWMNKNTKVGEQETHCAASPLKVFARVIASVALQHFGWSRGS